jgi:hypothetical protein
MRTRGEEVGAGRVREGIGEDIDLGKGRDPGERLREDTGEKKLFAGHDADCQVVEGKIGVRNDGEKQERQHPAWVESVVRELTNALLETFRSRGN